MTEIVGPTSRGTQSKGVVWPRVLVLWSALMLLGASGNGAPAADWIAEHCVTPEGALMVRPLGHFVSGYFGNITAQGLVAAGAHLDVVREWMTWYLDHAHGSGSGVDGVPDDGTYDAGSFVSRGRPDSTDAYGATFLTLAYAAYRSGDPALRSLLLGRRNDVLRVAASMLATQQPNGLTFSRPQHAIAYTIDNAQVYRGLLDGATLVQNAYGDAQRASSMRAQAAIVQHGIESVLWDPASQTYRPEVNAHGYGASADLTNPYPDALAQVMTIVYGVIPPSSLRASTLLARASASLLEPVHGDADEYRSVVAIARAMTGQQSNADAPFTPPPICADAGWYLLSL
jgi:hypothetical protein